MVGLHGYTGALPPTTVSLTVGWIAQLCAAKLAVILREVRFNRSFELVCLAGPANRVQRQIKRAGHPSRYVALV